MLPHSSPLYAIVDIETTGGYASAHGITEIAVFVHDGEKVVRHFETLINPQQDIPRYITALTGISNAMVASAPLFEEVAETLHELLHPNIFIAHNVNFDYSFVKHHLKSAGFDLAAKKLCTVRLGRKVFPGLPSYSLGNFCRSRNIEIDNRHRAGGDAKATVELFEQMLSSGAQLHIDQMLKRSSGEQWLPIHLPKAAIDALPSGPGVYYFHDKKDKIIYVGKAINIKKRVSGHFTQNDAERKRQNLYRHIHKISFSECANELQALVLESSEIQRLWPKFNASQKQPIQKYGLYLFEDNAGYLRIGIEKKKKSLPSLYTFNLLHEGEVMLRKMVEEFELNAKLCFIDKHSLSDEEKKRIGTPGRYNKKVVKAIEALNKQLPTFAIVDNGIKENERLYLLIEKGAFWGMGYVQNEFKVKTSMDLKDHLMRYADNDFIRNSIYSFADAYPEKRVNF